MSPRRYVVAAVLVSLAGCGEPRLPSGWTTAESAAFQREHAQAVAAELGPLSAVASYYVGPGRALRLGLDDDGELTDAPTPDQARVRIEVTDAGASCVQGCGPAAVGLDEPRTLAVDRFTLMTSPQSGTLRVLVLDPLAPARAKFSGLAWFPVDERFIVPARWEPDPQRPLVELSTSRGLTKGFARAGMLRAVVLGRPIALVGYQQGPSDTPLLVPLTDETTGESTYPVGRYLEVSVPDDGVPVLDLNRLTNPWCAYSEHFNCPVPPADNRVPVAVEAGERVYGEH
ncbi:MAG: DUF1684 domain-containing protein [Nannocystaceae bacterium]